MVGLYGSGKTTTISKLAAYYAKRGNKVCAIGLDVHRPAAPEQLKQLCDKLGVACFIDKSEKDPKKIWKKFESELKDYSLVLVDTSGRDALDELLIKEMKDIAKLAKPTETLLVMPADIGQAAKKQAQGFKSAVNITGVVITRMDSTAKGGGALTACAEVQAPVIFIGTGEKSADLELFNPESFLSRLLGMGDLQALMDKVHSVMSEKQIEETQKKLREGKFTMYEFEQQMEAMGEMGSMDKLLSLIPGMGAMKEKIPEGALESQQGKVKNWKAAIKSMTKEEKENPELLEKQTSRIQRIAKGAGITTTDVRMLIKQYRMIKEMIKSQSGLEEGKLDNKTMMKLARKFGKKMKL
jgi:signal recognition particle subunit SRP54